jgi:hypothetical protein
VAPFSQETILKYAPLPDNEVTLFCEEFLRTNDPCLAAKAIGLAGNKGTELLKTDQIRKHLVHRYKAIQETYAIECNEVIAYLMGVMRHNPRDFIDWTNGSVIVKSSALLSDEQARLVAGIKRTVDRHGNECVNIELPSKFQAADKLARIFGLYNESIQISGPGGGPIPLQALPADVRAIAAEYTRQMALAEREKLCALPEGHVVDVAIEQEP